MKRLAIATIVASLALLASAGSAGADAASFFVQQPPAYRGHTGKLVSDHTACLTAAKEGRQHEVIIARALVACMRARGWAFCGWPSSDWGSLAECQQLGYRE